ncbi:MAG: M16 family metallopeptidase [Candidatus Methylacidiphilales bacterium]
MLNRKEAPFATEISGIKIKETVEHTFQNGIKLYALNAGNEEVLKLDIVFNAGAISQVYKGQANFTAKMLSEGTSKYTAAEIAEKLDFYGAYFQAKSGTDDAVITLYCINKHLTNCLPFIVEILTDSIIPENDLAILKKNTIQNLIVNEERNSFLARRTFNQSIFGNTVYGGYSTKEDINKIEQNILVDFYKNQYQKGIKYILVSGLVNDMVIGTIANNFDNNLFLSNERNNHNYQETIFEKETIFVEKPNSIQSAIRIGKKLFNRNNPDFREVQLLNLILGGYFGSRLMKNIREEKGLTYGIYSAIEAYPNDACWYIDTEMNNELCEKGIEEIYKEVKLLRTKKIGQDELRIAKNYLLGSFMRSIDGPFSLADRFKILKDYNLSYSYYYEYIEIIKNSTSESLLELANKYFNEESFTNVRVGAKN